MPKLRQFSKLFCWHKKTTHALPTAIDHKKVRNPGTRGTLRLRKTLILLLLTVLMKLRQVWSNFDLVFKKKKFLSIREINETYPLIPQQLPVTLPLLRKAKSKIIRTCASLSVDLVIKKTIISTTT